MSTSVLGEVAHAVESLLPSVDVGKVKGIWDGNSVVRLLAVFALNNVVSGGAIHNMIGKSIHSHELAKIAEVSSRSPHVFYAALGVVVQSAKSR